MKATGIDAVYFAVTDVPRAKTFYSGLLDVAEVTMESEHAVEFVLRDGSAFGFGKYSHEKWVPSGCVLFHVDDADAAAQSIASLGGRLLGEVRDFPNCRAQWCEDPDGNSLVLHQRKAGA